MGDAYGLARHRDGRWEWAAAPGTLAGRSHPFKKKALISCLIKDQPLMKSSYRLLNLALFEHKQQFSPFSKRVQKYGVLSLF